MLTAIYYINMIDPYRMVFVNVFLSSFFILAFLFYKFIYPKKTPPYILMLFLISLLPLVSILRKGSYESGDLSLHAMRTISFYKILFEEHIRPVWTPEFNAGYGDPHFLFSYFLPYFLASVIHKIGFSFIFSIKALLAVTYIFSGIFMYIWVKYEINGKAGFTAAVFYLFAPYHLVDIHFRVTVAESMSFAFIPILGWFWAWLYGSIGVIIGVTVAFYIARRFREPVVARFVPLKKLHVWEDKLSKRTEFLAFLGIRITTGPILDFISYVAGLSKISYKKFLAATLIAQIPEAIWYYFGGSLFERLSRTQSIASAAILVIILVTAFYIVKNHGIFRKKEL